MKTKMKVISVLCVVGFSGVVNADCPASMKADELTECIMIEGSGENYQQWKKEYDKLADISEQSKVETTVSMTVPGVDVTQVKPSAGKVE